ncbi:MAG: helix-turn-helix domain-containing protein [Clostridiales bacterium]|nr:helix-turn-helix domain-containing protein [Clostridiales bacterium]
MDFHKLGRAIKKRRTALKLTQQQLAEMINKSTVYVSLIESGARRPSLDTLLNIAYCLKTSLDAIISDRTTREGASYVDEFEFLLSERSSGEKALVMDTMREMLLHINNGEVIEAPQRGLGNRQKQRAQGAQPAAATPPLPDGQPDQLAHRLAMPVQRPRRPDPAPAPGIPEAGGRPYAQQFDDLAQSASAHPVQEKNRAKATTPPAHGRGAKRHSPEPAPASAPEPESKSESESGPESILTSI